MAISCRYLIMTRYFKNVLERSFLPLMSQIGAVCTHGINAETFFGVLFRHTRSAISAHAFTKRINDFIREVEHVIGYWMTRILQMDAYLQGKEKFEVGNGIRYRTNVEGRNLILLKYISSRSVDAHVKPGQKKQYKLQKRKFASLIDMTALLNT